MPDEAAPPELRREGRLCAVLSRSGRHASEAQGISVTPAASQMRVPAGRPDHPGIPSRTAAAIAGSALASIGTVAWQTGLRSRRRSLLPGEDACTSPHTFDSAPSVCRSVFVPKRESPVIEQVRCRGSMVGAFTHHVADCFRRAPPFAQTVFAADSRIAPCICQRGPSNLRREIAARQNARHSSLWRGGWPTARTSTSRRLPK